MPRKAARASSTADHGPFQAQLATLVDQAPSGDAWLHEVKYDGYRIGCSIVGERVRLESRNGQDWTAAFSPVVEAARTLGVKSALLDGEVAILTSDGKTSFQALQNTARSGKRREGQLVYLVFDLLELDGEDLKPRTLDERKARLAQLLQDAPPSGVLRYAQHFVGRGADVLAQACKLGLEGIVSKRRDQPYRPGRNTYWVKTKCLRRQEFVVGGFTEPEGSRKGFGSLLLGYYDEQGVLRFAGKAGNGPGFTATYTSKVRRELERLEQPTCPFTPAPPRAIARRSHWVVPKRVVEVSFLEWTDDGSIRHPLVQGFREDKDPREVRRETPSHQAANAERVREPEAPVVARARAPRAPSTKESVDVLGVRITTPERPMYPALGLSKLDLARYYQQVARWMLPHLAGRPLALVRCAKGVTQADALRSQCSFLKHAPAWHRWADASLKRLAIVEQKKVGEYLVANSAEALVALVQGDIVEIHAWGSTERALEQPDRIVFDLDPGPGVPWAEVVDAAVLVRGVLEDIGLRTWPKLTGGKGVHLVAPIKPEHDWERVYAATELIATTIARREPKRFTTLFAKAQRKGRILIDYKRNHRTATAVVAYSTRAHPQATVALPVRWEELTEGVQSDAFWLQRVLERVARMRSDPWRGFWSCEQALPGAGMRGA